MQLQQSALLAAGVVTLAFFVLVGYLVRLLRHTRRPAVVLAAVTTLLGALPAILYVMSTVSVVPPLR
ncbi:hypothetical protein ACFVVA_25225 [Kitasatospora sp. NPDC058048]|uniref:hypothetical protein n=1 Tax=Kitasatospora sp. NPDC058048 TaxID=3346313 RepID=UPI0036DC9A5F